MREPGSGTRMVAQQVFEAHGAAPRVRMELSTNEAIKQAILAGLGVSIMSRYTLGLDVEHDQLVMLDVEGFPLERHWYFVYPVGKQLPVVGAGIHGFRAQRRQAPGTRSLVPARGRDAAPIRFVYQFIRFLNTFPHEGLMLAPAAVVGYNSQLKKT